MSSVWVPENNDVNQAQISGSPFETVRGCRLIENNGVLSGV
jgi:hypothetical protein